MAYKSLGDRARRRALPAFLAAADQIEGLLFVVRVSKRVGALFVDADAPLSPMAEQLARWPPKTAERLLRICHFAALTLAGLSRPGQDVLWITDQDDVAANEDRHRLLTQAFGTISSHYLEHDLGHLRVATTASDTGQRDLEDIVNLTDLAAGAVGQVLDRYEGVEWLVPGLIRPPPAVPGKARRVLDWLSDAGSRLKRTVVSIEPASSATRLRIRQFEFMGSRQAPSPSMARIDPLAAAPASAHKLK